MNIHPDAIRDYLARRRDNHDALKRVAAAQLLAELQALQFAEADSARPLLQHQRVCALLGIAYPAFAFWLDMGLGKTRLALELIRYRMQQREIRGTLIFAKSDAAVLTWEDQIKEWRFEYPYILLLKGTSSKDKWAALEQFKEGVIIGSYGGITRMLTKNGVTAKGKNKLDLDAKLLLRMRALVQCLVPDEATSLANKDSLISRLFAQLRKSAPYCYELAGIPLGRDPTMLHRQLFLIDGGESLGETLGIFRAAFFRERRNYWGGFEYTFNRAQDAQLRSFIKHRSITYSEGECLDLPRVVHSKERIVLPYEALAYYGQQLKQLKQHKASFQVRKNAFIRMRQISSGYLGVVDDETGEKCEIDFTENPKLERLVELVSSVPKQSKFVIFHEYIYSGKLISEALAAEGILHERVWGGTKDMRQVSERFQHDERCRGLVLSHKLGAYSLNLQRANFVFVFEAPVSPIDNAQMRKRVARQGQTRVVFEYDLVCHGTVDERILQFHKQGNDLFKALIKDPSCLLPAATATKR